MTRSDFLSAMAALFCGLVLPEPLRETIRIATTSEILQFTDVRMGPIRIIDRGSLPEPTHELFLEESSGKLGFRSLNSKL